MRSQDHPYEGWLDKRPRRPNNSQRLNDAGFHFVQAMVERLLATRKRVLVLFPTEAVLDLILLFLFPNVFLYGCSIDPYCTYVISRCPEIPVSVLVLQVRVPLEDHHRTLFK